MKLYKNVSFLCFHPSGMGIVTARGFASFPDKEAATMWE